MDSSLKPKINDDTIISNIANLSIKKDAPQISENLNKINSYSLKRKSPEFSNVQKSKKPKLRRCASAPL